MTHTKNQSDHPEMLLRTWELTDDRYRTVIRHAHTGEIAKTSYEIDTGRRVIVMREVEE